MKKLTHVFFHWLPLGVAIVFVFFIVYTGLQQDMRQGLNDPQIAMVTDAQIAIESGTKTPKQVVGSEVVDIEKSLSPFMIVFDESGNVLESSGVLNGTPPKVPQGVLDFAKANGEDRVTWQPNDNTRIALVVRPLHVESGWFVAAGRNMREVENRIEIMSLKLIIAFCLTLLATYIADVIGDEYRRRQMQLNKQ